MHFPTLLTAALTATLALAYPATDNMKRQSASPSACTTTGPEADLIRKFVSFYSAADTPGMLSLMSKNFTRYSSTTRTPMNKTRWGEMSTNFYLAFPDERWELLNLQACGPEVKIDVTERGTFKNDWVMFDGYTIKPTGKAYEGNSTITYQVRDNLIQSYQQKTGIAFLQVGLSIADMLAIVRNGY